MCGKWTGAIFSIALISCLFLYVCLQTGTAADGDDYDVSITYIGAGVGNLTMEEILAAQQNQSGNASSAPDLVFQNTESQTLTFPEDNILNGTNHTSPKELGEEPRNENVMLMFASLIPIIGMPFLLIINDRHRSMILRAETLGR